MVESAGRNGKPGCNSISQDLGNPHPLGQSLSRDRMLSRAGHLHWEYPFQRDRQFVSGIASTSQLLNATLNDNERP
jgi:hypothetical protein